MKVHSTHSIRFTKRAEVITLLANAYRRLYPNSTFTSMAEYLGISRSAAHRYYYGLNHGYNRQSMLRGSAVTIDLDKNKAAQVLYKISDFKKKYDF
jgi:hypothetical protein